MFHAPLDLSQLRIFRAIFPSFPAFHSFSTNTTLGQLTGFALNASIDSSLREALDVLWRGSVRHATP